MIDAQTVQTLATKLDTRAMTLAEAKTWLMRTYGVTAAARTRDQFIRNVAALASSEPNGASTVGLGFGRVGLPEQQAAISVTPDSFQPVPPLADGAHEVQPEAIEAGLGLVGGELGLAADANPHAASIHQCAAALRAALARCGGAP